MNNRTVARPPTAEEETAVMAGARAGRAGECATTNPYEKDTPLWSMWVAAWLRPGMYIGEDSRCAERIV